MSTKKTNKGGKREGAGRPINSGKYGEKTVLIRIPESLSTKVNKLLELHLKKLKKIKD